MIDKYELQKEANKLREAITIATTSFVFEPNIADYIKRLDELEKECEHEYLNGTCILCGKEINNK